MLVLPKRINEREAACVIKRSRVESLDRWLPHCHVQETAIE